MIANSRVKVVRVCQCRICGEAFLHHCRADPDLDAAFVLDDAANLLAKLVGADPDIVVLDVDVRGGGFDLAGRLRDCLADAKLVFLAKSAPDASIKQALVLGAKGFLLTNESGDALVRLVRQVADGEHCFSEAVAKRIAYDSAQGAYRLRGGTLFDSLTDLQMEILRHLARGDSLKMVARKMNLTRKSVDGHKYRIMKKIGVQDRVLLSRLAIREGLIEA